MYGHAGGRSIYLGSRATTEWVQVVNYNHPIRRIRLRHQVRPTNEATSSALVVVETRRLIASTPMGDRCHYRLLVLPPR